MGGSSPDWTFFTNHTHVLLSLARHGDVPLRQVAQEIGITERAVQRILGELEAAGAVTRRREGRQNSYALNLTVALRHPLEKDHTIGEVLALFLKPNKARG